MNIRKHRYGQLEKHMQEPEYIEGGQSVDIHVRHVRERQEASGC